MLLIFDPDLLREAAENSVLPADETVRTLLTIPGAALASSSLPVVQRLMKKNGICGKSVKEILKLPLIVKTPPYVDLENEFAEIDLEKYLAALAAEAIDGKFVTRDEHALRVMACAVTPEEADNGTVEIKFCDLKKQYDLLHPDLERRIDTVMRHGQYIQGPEVRELEKRCAEFTDSRFAIGAASGTDALMLALMAYDVGPGDYVITTPFTFIATAEVVSLLGAKPLFTDIDPCTYNICPEAVSSLLDRPLDPATGKPIAPEKIKGIIAVDIFGQPADYDALREATAGRNLFIIEDGAQSFGATYKGRPACSLGDISTTSFFPAKPLGCYGDGGMIFTESEDLAVKLRQLLNHGQEKRYHHALIGINGRLDTLQAAVLLAKLDLFVEKEIALRSGVAAMYSQAIAASKAAAEVGLPFIRQYVDTESRSAWAQFSILVHNRDAVQQILSDRKIPTAVHYPIPLHRQPAFAGLGYRAGDFPVSEKTSSMIMSLPMDPWKNAGEIETVASALAAAVHADKSS